MMKLWLFDYSGAHLVTFHIITVWNSQAWLVNVLTLYPVTSFSSDSLLLLFYIFLWRTSISCPCCQWLYYSQYAFHFITAVSSLCGQWKDADELSGCMNLTQYSMLSSLFSITRLIHHLPPYLHATYLGIVKSLYGI